AYDAHSPSAVYVEDASAGVALIQELKRESRLPVVPVKALGSKISRVEGITGMLESGRVFLPTEAPWLVEFERELLAFPNAKHDDMVDAFVLALSQVVKRPFSEAFLIGMTDDRSDYGPAPIAPGIASLMRSGFF
ncbi:MAG: phage terminase large subunit, partial [Candidatus Eremiobacteraeota bacterium]|nr:phage terminase large subunit [Candidatus Eremiobacteraeota bacterium]